MILAIDPANEFSAYCFIDKETYKPIEFGKIPNEELLEKIYLQKESKIMAIEMIASYGMPVGKTTFETCMWIGRFIEAFHNCNIVTDEHILVYRKDVKINLCGSMKAKDSNIRQALIDRFGEVGVKKNQGFFYGFKADIWSAFAVGCTYLDRKED